MNQVSAHKHKNFDVFFSMCLATILKTETLNGRFLGKTKPLNLVYFLTNAYVIKDGPSGVLLTHHKTTKMRQTYQSSCDSPQRAKGTGESIRCVLFHLCN